MSPRHHGHDLARRLVRARRAGAVGLADGPLLFAGFLPVKAGARRAALAELRGVPATLVLLESAPRLAASLADMAAELGDRPAAVARELTKLHEEVRRGPLAALAAHYRGAGPPKGELAVVVGPPEPQAAAVSGDALDAALASALAEMGVKDAAPPSRRRWACRAAPSMPAR